MIKDEFNKKAHYTDLNSLQLGSINGLYILEYDDLNKLFFNNQKKAESSSLIIEKNNLLIGILVVLLIFG